MWRVFVYAPPTTDDAGYAVVTERFVVLLSADAGADTATAVHQILDGEHATAEQVLHEFNAPTFVSRFALVEVISSAEQHFHVTVRGDITVDLGGASTSRFTWPHGQRWLTGDAYGVQSLHLSLSPTAVGAPQLPLRNGAVPATAIALSVVLPRVPAAPGGDTPTDDAPAEVAADDAPVDTTANDAAVGTAADVPVDDGADDVASVGDTSVGDVPAEDAPAEDAPAEDPPANADARPAAVDRRPTMIDLSALSALTTPDVWTLTLPDGNELEAAPQIVVGRRPWNSDPEATQTYYVVTPSPHREISGKHVEFTVVGDQLRARDMDSTNGTVISTPNSAPRLLHGGETTLLQVGDTLDLGEGFTILVGARR